MTNINIFDLHPKTLSKEHYVQLAENQTEMIELSDEQTKNIAGGFWFCPFLPRFTTYSGSVLFPNQSLPNA